ncbi:hypothetical protein [Pedobacter sp. G11]|uniref:hypothetical protein n=1 Tax=Pedobacter sp. G11 TaxID=2482728 RepID=UPI00143D7D57|nr:hypothetical protein [Pedobacter sp. G11]
MTPDTVVRAVSVEKNVVDFTLAINDTYLSEDKSIEVDVVRRARLSAKYRG